MPAAPGPDGAAPPFYSTSTICMVVRTLQIGRIMAKMLHRTKVVSGGRLQVPAELRRQLGLADGDEVKMSVVDGELRVRSTRIDWDRIHALARKYVPEGVSVVDELIADRRAEAARE